MTMTLESFFAWLFILLVLLCEGIIFSFVLYPIIRFLIKIYLRMYESMEKKKHELKEKKQ